MSEISKTIGQWIVSNVGWSVLIFLFLLSGLFKITKIEINPLGWIIGWIGKNFTKDVRQDVADVKQSVEALKANTNAQFEQVKRDREVKIDELKADYNNQISVLRTDLDAFEKRTDTSISELKKGTALNCEAMKKRIDEMEAATQKSNDLQTIRQIRAHVLDFANSCMNKRKHTKLDFENIMDENKQYKELIRKYDITNDVYTEDYEFIMKIYHKCQDEGSFLNESEHAG